MSLVISRSLVASVSLILLVSCLTRCRSLVASVSLILLVSCLTRCCLSLTLVLLLCPSLESRRSLSRPPSLTYPLSRSLLTRCFSLWLVLRLSHSLSYLFRTRSLALSHSLLLSLSDSLEQGYSLFHSLALSLASPLSLTRCFSLSRCFSHSSSPRVRERGRV